MKKRKAQILVFLGVLLACWCIAIQFETYTQPDTAELKGSINFLSQQTGVQEECRTWWSSTNPEWRLFSYAFTTYALTSITQRDSQYKSQAVDIVHNCLLNALSASISGSFGTQNPWQLNDSTFNSVLYLGHLNLMIGCYQHLSSDTTFRTLQQHISKYLLIRYRKSALMNLESYQGQIWIPDNSVAIASLHLYATQNGLNAADVVNTWEEYLRDRYTDAASGLPCSKIDPRSGAQVEGPRASMLGWTIMFMTQFDTTSAQQLYFRFKDQLSTEAFVCRLFKERKGYETGVGDIDSGPLFLGYGMPANVFALGTAVLANDMKTARKLERLINTGSHQVQVGDGLKYQLRGIGASFSPLADALILNSKCITPWVP